MVTPGWNHFWFFTTLSSLKKANIDKLNGENYAICCIQMKSLLITLDLHHTLLGQRPEGDKEAKCLVDDSKALAIITLIGRELIQ